MPEGQAQTAKLAALIDIVPKVAKLKLKKVKHLGNSWNVLDMLYGNRDGIGIKLKEKMENLKLHKISSQELSVELFDTSIFMGG